MISLLIITRIGAIDNRRRVEDVQTSIQSGQDELV